MPEKRGIMSVPSVTSLPQANQYFFSPAEIQTKYTVESSSATKYRVLKYIATFAIVGIFVAANLTLGLTGKTHTLVAMNLVVVPFLPRLLYDHVLKKIDDIYRNHKTNAEIEQGVLNSCAFIGPYAPDSKYIYVNNETDPYCKGLYARYAYWNNKTLDLESDLQKLKEEKVKGKPETETQADFDDRMFTESANKTDEMLEAKAQAAYFYGVYHIKNTASFYKDDEENNYEIDFKDLCTFAFKKFDHESRLKARNGATLAKEMQATFKEDDTANAGIVLGNQKHLPWEFLLNKATTIPLLAQILIDNMNPQPAAAPAASVTQATPNRAPSLGDAADISAEALRIGVDIARSIR